MNPAELDNWVEVLEPDELYAALAVHGLKLLAGNPVLPETEATRLKDSLQLYLLKLASPNYLLTVEEDRQFFSDLRLVDSDIPMIYAEHIANPGD